MFNDSSMCFTFGDSIKIAKDGTNICIGEREEIISAAIYDKKIYANSCGEYVVELSGLSSDDKNGNRSWAIAYFDPMGHSKKHYHKIGRETYYVLSGVAEVIIDGETRILKSGHQITIEPEQHHQVKCLDSVVQLMMAVKCVPSWVPEDQHFVDTPSHTIEGQIDVPKQLMTL